MNNNFLSLDDAAKELGVSSDELIEMRSRGEIFGYRNGSSWKFKPEEVERVKAELDSIARETRQNLEQVLENTTPNITYTGNSYTRTPDDEIIDAEFEPKNTAEPRAETADPETRRRVEEFLKLQEALTDVGASNEGSSEVNVIDLGHEHRNGDLEDSDIFANSDLDLGEEGQNTPDANNSMAQSSLDDEDDLDIDPVDPEDLITNLNEDLSSIMPGEFYTLEEAATHLGISPEELRSLRDIGHIRGFPNGNSLNFKGSDLVAFKNNVETPEETEPVVIELEDKDEFPANQPNDEMITLGGDSTETNDAANANNADVENNKHQSLWQKFTGLFSRNNKRRLVVTEEEDNNSGSGNESEDNQDDTAENTKKNVWERTKNWFTGLFTKKKDGEVAEVVNEEGSKNSESREKKINTWINHQFKHLARIFPWGNARSIKVPEIDIEEHIFSGDVQSTKIAEVEKSMNTKKREDLKAISDPIEKREVGKAIEDCNNFYLELTTITKLVDTLGKKRLKNSEKAEAEKLLSRFNTAMHRVVHTYSNYLDPNIPPALDTPEEKNILLPRMQWIIGVLQEMNASKFSHRIGKKIGGNGKKQVRFVQELLNTGYDALQKYEAIND